MEFKVKFVASSLSIDHEGVAPGIDALDAARRQIGRNIDPEKLSFDDPRIENPTVSLTEGAARDSGLFFKETTVLVYTPDEFLNQFCAVYPIAHFDNGEVTWHIEFDEDLCLEAWADAGYPKDWRETA